MYQEKIKSLRRLIRNRIVREAREWVGTPYHHQAMVKGVGCDCVGLIVGVGISVDMMDITEDQIQRYQGYGRLPNPKRMEKHMEEHLVRIKDDEVSIGDIAWIQWRRNLPMHLAIVGADKDRYTLIHAYYDVGKVTEHYLDMVWDSRIVSFWRYPGLLDWRH